VSKRRRRGRPETRPPHLAHFPAEPEAVEDDGDAEEELEVPEAVEPVELVTAEATEPPVRVSNLPALDERTVYTGALLEAVREARGISLKEVSAKTRIGVPSLQAVEEERFADLPNARIYVRGFVRCLAQEIGLDAEQVARTYLPRWERWFEEQKSRKSGFLKVD